MIILSKFYLSTNRCASELSEKKKTLKFTLKSTLKQLLVSVTQTCLLGLDKFHIRTVHLDIIKVLFIHQVMH